VALAVCVVISNVGNMAVRTALLLVAYRVFALGPDGAGWILAVGGLASVIGATLAGRVSARLGVGPSLVLATTVEGLAWAIAPLGFLLTPLVVLGVASIVSGLMTPVWNVNVVTLRQRIVARDEQGRVVAVSRAFATAGVGMGALTVIYVVCHLSVICRHTSSSASPSVGPASFPLAPPGLLHRPVRSLSLRFPRTCTSCSTWSSPCGSLDPDQPRSPFGAAVL